MRLFLDSSARCSPPPDRAGVHRVSSSRKRRRTNCEPVSSDYCAEETRRNLPKLGPAAAKAWKTQIAPRIRFVRTTVALDKPLVFPKAKDRPVVITALASRSDWLLTLDEGDFHTKLGREVYGLCIATPGEFLLEQRLHGAI